MLFYHNTGGGEDFHAGGNIFQKIFPPGGEDFTGGNIYFYTGIVSMAADKRQISLDAPAPLTIQDKVNWVN